MDLTFFEALRELTAEGKSRSGQIFVGLNATGMPGIPPLNLRSPKGQWARQTFPLPLPERISTRVRSGGIGVRRTRARWHFCQSVDNRMSLLVIPELPRAVDYGAQRPD